MEIFLKRKESECYRVCEKAGNWSRSVWLLGHLLLPEGIEMAVGSFAWRGDVCLLAHQNRLYDQFLFWCNIIHVWFKVDDLFTFLKKKFAIFKCSFYSHWTFWKPSLVPMITNVNFDWGNPEATQILYPNRICACLPIFSFILVFWRMRRNRIGKEWRAER